MPINIAKVLGTRHTTHHRHYDELVCVRGERVKALWPIAARGALL